MTWQFGVASDIGGREEQQDRVEVISSPGGEEHLVIVADGMGGHHGGAAAAQAVIDASRQFFESANGADPLSLLEQQCLKAHEVVGELAGNSSPSPGSTCVMLYVSGDEACWAHVGDSRLYHIRDGKVLNRTHDHSMVQLLVAEGKMTESEMASSPLQNQLYMCLGGGELPKPDLGATDALEGDIFMLCSDGFWETVSQDEVMDAMSQYSPEDAAAMLVETAKERGGDSGDNISLAIARFEKERKKFPWFS